MSRAVSKTATDNTEGQQRGGASNLIPFKPGQSGNPKGRPKGSRNQLGEDFLWQLASDFSQHGAGVIAKVREERPADYLKIVASLLPRDAVVSPVDPLEDISDEELAEMIEHTRRQIAASKEAGQ